MSLFRRRPAPRASEPRIPEGQRIFVFGDVHGRLDLLERIFRAIGALSETLPPATVTVVGLGDYIDRGPDSRGVVDRLLNERTGSCFIRGNHEQALLDFLEAPERNGPAWLRYGGDATLRSYAIDPRLFLGALADYAALREEFIRRMPPAHILFLQRLPLSFELGDYFFVHAGARPGIPLAQQSGEDMLWIREGFADRDDAFERVVVHGHTPVDKPYVGTYRINLDTGAYFSSRLSCLMLEGAERILVEI